LRAKLRLQTILKTLQGEITVAEACQKLGVGESRFHALRNEWLQAALELLEPRPLGRPPQAVSPDAEQLARLQAENQDLKQQWRLAEVREELARVMPHVLQPPDSSCKKGNAAGSKPR
jgi:transposase